MQVTNIKVDSFSPRDNGVCAEFTLTFDDVLVVHKVFVINGKKGLFIAFPNNGTPSRINQKKRYYDIVHPANQTFRQEIEKQVFTKYENLVENS